MLENVILDTDVNKDQIKNTLKAEAKRLGERLSVLQQEIKRTDTACTTAAAYTE